MKIWEGASLQTIRERLGDVGQRRVSWGAKRGETPSKKTFTVWWHFESSRENGTPLCQARHAVSADLAHASEVMGKPRSMNVGDPMPEDLQALQATLYDDFPAHGWTFVPCPLHEVLFPEAVDKG